jgi:hypothetical protein
MLATTKADIPVETVNYFLILHNSQLNQWDSYMPCAAMAHSTKLLVGIPDQFRVCPSCLIYQSSDYRGKRTERQLKLERHRSSALLSSETKS